MHLIHAAHQLHIPIGKYMLLLLASQNNYVELESFLKFDKTAPIYLEQLLKSQVLLTSGKGYLVNTTTKLGSAFSGLKFYFPRTSGGEIMKAFSGKFIYYKGKLQEIAPTKVRPLLKEFLSTWPGTELELLEIVETYYEFNTEAITVKGRTAYKFAKTLKGLLLDKDKINSFAKRPARHFTTYKEL